jgi:hypothetical protein
LPTSRRDRVQFGLFAESSHICVGSISSGKLCGLLRAQSEDSKAVIAKFNTAHAWGKSEAAKKART